MMQALSIDDDVDDLNEFRRRLQECNEKVLCGVRLKRGRMLGEIERKGSQYLLKTEAPLR